MKKKILICVLILLFIATILFLIFVFVSRNNDYKNFDIAKFNSQYKELKGNVNSFNSKRKDIYESLFNEAVISDLKGNYSKYIKIFNNYEDIAIQLKENSPYLNEICFNSKVYLNEIIKKCNTYKEIYKKSNNLFLDDSYNFNEKLIKKYNDLNVESKLELYNGKKIKKYID